MNIHFNFIYFGAGKMFVFAVHIWLDPLIVLYSFLYCIWLYYYIFFALLIHSHFFVLLVLVFAHTLLYDAFRRFLPIWIWIMLSLNVCHCFIFFSSSSFSSFFFQNCVMQFHCSLPSENIFCLSGFRSFSYHLYYFYFEKRNERIKNENKLLILAFFS